MKKIKRQKKKKMKKIFLKKNTQKNKIENEFKCEIPQFKNVKCLNDSV